MDADDEGVRAEGPVGDWEDHERLATRFGFSCSLQSRRALRERGHGSSDNTTLRFADSMNPSTPARSLPTRPSKLADYTMLAFEPG